MAELINSNQGEDSEEKRSNASNGVRLPKSIKPKRAVKSTVDRLKTIKRLVHYYEVLAGYKSGFRPTHTKYPFIDLLQKIITDINNGDIDQHAFSDKTFLIPHLEYNKDNDIYQGKLYTVRSEDFPQLINVNTKVIRDIEAAVDDGIVETSHFLIYCKKNYPQVAYEYNQHGGRINDLLRCLSNSGTKHDITIGMTNQKIVSENLDSFIKRMGKLSRMTVKVHRSNLSIVENVSPKLASGLNGIIEEFEGEYGEINVKFSYDEVSRNSGTFGMIKDVIGEFIKNPLRQKAFDKFIVDAEDIENQNRLHAFDLLLERVRSELKVERKEKSRIINSDNTFKLMNEEFKKLDV
jgi:hypothetical protein